MKSPEKILSELTQDQKDYLAYFYKIPSGTVGRKGSLKGLIARGLLDYAWGRTPQMGYKATSLGLAVSKLLNN
jgi:hypothetical protein